MSLQLLSFLPVVPPFCVCVSLGFFLVLYCCGLILFFLDFLKRKYTQVNIKTTCYVNESEEFQPNSLLQYTIHYLIENKWRK